MNDMKRLEAIDILRGILVICVVLGHAIQQYAGKLGPFWAETNRIIYSFHMPAFVFVSGLCALRLAELSGPSEKMGYIRSRAVRLLVPYVVWGLLYFALRFVAGDVARIQYRMDCAWLFFFGYNPDGAMWFLWALFAVTVLAVPCGRLFRRTSFLLGTGFVVLMGLWALPTPPFRFHALHMLPLFFLLVGLGVQMRGKLVRLAESLRLSVLTLVIGVMAFVIFWTVRGWRIVPHFPWYVLTSVAASLALLALSVLLARFAVRGTRVLAFLGTEAMAIYVLGEPIKVCCRLCFKALHLPVGVSFALTVALVLALPIVLSWLIAKNGVLSVLLLGVRAKASVCSER